MDTQIANSATPDATTLSKGKIQLAGDLAGNADVPVIGNNKVTTAKILNGNVTYAKIQNVSASDKVLGRVSAGAGMMEEIATSGTGNVVRTTSPVLVTPDIGAASATSVNNLAITAPATGATLTIADGKTLQVTDNATLSGINTGDQTLTGLGGVPVGRTITVNGTTQDLSADRSFTVTDITGNAA